MNALQLLRTMHADTKVRFKLILGTDDPNNAAQQWAELQPLLTLHELLEDEYLYAPVFKEMGPGTPLGDWEFQHESDVAIVEQLVEAAKELTPATPEWRMAIARIVDALTKHVSDEEGQIFGSIEQMWGPARLDQAGQQMQQTIDDRTQPPAKQAAARRKR
jgi:hypothetical protein